MDILRGAFSIHLYHGNYRTPWGLSGIRTYLENSALDGPRPPGFPIEHLAGPVFDEMGCDFLKGRSARVSNEYLPYAATQRPPNKPAQRIDHAVPVTDISADHHIDALQLPHSELLQVRL